MPLGIGSTLSWRGVKFWICVVVRIGFLMQGFGIRSSMEHTKNGSVVCEDPIIQTIHLPILTQCNRNDKTMREDSLLRSGTIVQE